MKPFVVVHIHLIQGPPRNLLGGAIVDLIAQAPQEEVIYFRICYDAVVMKDVYALFPNLRGLHFALSLTPLPFAFPKLDFGEGGEFLQFVFLDKVVVGGADWNPFTTFLDRRASSGNPLRTLIISGRVPPVWKELERAVRVYKHI